MLIQPRSMFLAALLIFTPAASVGADTVELTDAQRMALRRTPIVEVFEHARDSVVNISSTEVVTVRHRGGNDWFFDELFEDPFDMPRSPRTREYRRTSIGSGFVLHEDGYIVTNAHVVARTMQRLVTFADGSEHEADLIAIDVERDLAILKINAQHSLNALPLGRSSDLMIGETAIAIGNPLGYQHSITSGVVSAVDRDLEFGPEKVFTGLVQTDASVNPGNSGGPLLNVLGELIGINTAVRTDAQNIGFAIPVDQLRQLLPELLDLERRYRIEIGMQIENLDAPRVAHVRSGSPADVAGIQSGDIITQIDDKPIAGSVDYNVSLIGRKPGSKIHLAFMRDEREFETTLTIGKRPAPSGMDLARRKLGMDLQPVPEQLAQRLLLKLDTGLVVVQLETGSPAYQIGVEPGDVLVSIGRHYIRSLEDVGTLLESVDLGDVVAFSIVRQTSRGKVLLNGRFRSR